MPWLEDKLRPTTTTHPLYRDLYTVGLLAVLGMVLIPSWSGIEMPTDISELVCSFCLLPALGFLLALRQGAIDLSIWTSAAVGGLVAAALINAGIAPVAAFAIALGAGALIGAINGLLVSLCRVPSPLATGVIAVVLTWATHLAFTGREVVISEYAFDNWLNVPYLKLLTVRMLLTAFAYSTVMVALLLNEIHPHKPTAGTQNNRWDVFAALCGSSTLAALAGAAWLIDAGAAPIPQWPVDDLRIPTAAILAGGAFLAGRGRGLLAGVLLLPAIIITTLWRQETWAINWQGYELHVLLLAGMALVAQQAAAEAFAPHQRWQVVADTSVVLLSLGVVILAAATIPDELPRQKILYVAGLAIWSAGLALLLIVRARRSYC